MLFHSFVRFLLSLIFDIHRWQWFRLSFFVCDLFTPITFRHISNVQKIIIFVRCASFPFDFLCQGTKCPRSILCVCAFVSMTQLSLRTDELIFLSWQFLFCLFFAFVFSCPQLSSEESLILFHLRFFAQPKKQKNPMEMQAENSEKKNCQLFNVDSLKFICFFRHHSTRISLLWWPN